jgi:hypothetical protein
LGLASFVIGEGKLRQKPLVSTSQSVDHGVMTGISLREALLKAPPQDSSGTKVLSDSPAMSQPLAPDSTPTVTDAASPVSPGSDLPSASGLPVPADPPAKKEFGGRDGPEPTRFGDWEKSGRCIDF